MAAFDLSFFERFARPYALLTPPADPEPLRRALGEAGRPVERVVDDGFDCTVVGAKPGAP